MIKICTVFLVLLLFSVYSFSQEKRIVILHTNDMHSRLTGFSPESSYTPLSPNDDRTVGGFARIATIIRDEKARSGQTTIAVDAGDFLMGTLFHTLEESTGFELPLMKKMGYDVVALGNHEFDFGISSLTNILTRSAAAGSIPDILLGNAVFSQNNPADDALEALYGKGILRRSVIITADGVKIGFFSLLGKDASAVAPKAKPITFTDIISYSEKAVKELRSAGCDIVICVSHSGVSKDKNGNWAGEDAELAAKVRGIDLVISGHTHTKLDKALTVNGVPVVQTGEYGEFVGKVVFTGDKSGYKLESYELLPVDDRITGNKIIDEEVRKQEEKISERRLRARGLDYSEPIAEIPVTLECNSQGKLDESVLGPLVADALYWYINKNSAGGVDMSMISAGVIRDRMLPGVQSVADIFRVVPLGSGSDSIPGYALSRLYVTGRELKNIIEVLLVAQKSNSDYHCFFSGVSVDYDPSRGLLKKLSRIELVSADGKTRNVNFSKKDKTLYSVAANSYMLQFIGIIKKKTHGIVNVVPKNSRGEKVTDMSTAVIDIDEKQQGIQEGKEWLALVSYFSQMKDKNGNSLPDLDDRYLKPVSNFKVVKK
jgi:5'-nucleotidase / UDP-sugar diphosphatase